MAITAIVLGRGDRLWDDLWALDRDYAVTSEMAESGVIPCVWGNDGCSN